MGVLTLQPLVIDLDGTLIHTDTLHESALRLLRDRPWRFFRIPFWLLQGKASLKRQLAHQTAFDPKFLPYNRELLGWLTQQRVAGRTLILCTASDRSVATSIADHLGIFDEVMASDGALNLAGRHKAEALLKRFGQGGFDYAGNSTADLAVWPFARHAVVVNALDELASKAASCCKIEQTFPAKAIGFTAWLGIFRIHQWLKNLLLFVPLFAAHQLTSADTWLSLILAFLAFSLCASSVYITNDLLDLESDRHHPRKRHRPFASGLVPALKGVVLAPLLLAASLGLASFVSGAFLPWLMFYFVLSCAYSWLLKRFMLVDCLTLALLYTVRILAGTAAAGLSMSFWLLAFSVFLFLSLAFLKRFAELGVQMVSGKEDVHGRGYLTTDAPLIQTLGITSGYAAVLVLALYLNSEAVLKLYRSPEFVWGAIPVMLFWVSWMWMQAYRGKMHDDPLVFAVKDKASLLAGAAFASVLVIGTAGWQW